MEATRMKKSLLISIGILAVSAITLLWQYTTPSPLNFWTGLSLIAFISSLLSVFVNIGFEMGCEPWLALIGLIAGGMLIFSSPFSTEKSFIYLNIHRPFLDKNDASVSISQNSFETSEEGFVELRIENNSSFELELNSVVLSFPNKFFDGFIIDYEESEIRVSSGGGIRFGDFQLSGKDLTLSNIHINPMEIITLKISLIANLPGDYSGNIRTLYIESDSSEVRIYPTDNSIQVIVRP